LQINKQGVELQLTEEKFSSNDKSQFGKIMAKLSFLAVYEEANFNKIA